MRLDQVIWVRINPAANPIRSYKETLLAVHLKESYESCGLLACNLRHTLAIMLARPSDVKSLPLSSNVITKSFDTRHVSGQASKGCTKYALLYAFHWITNILGESVVQKRSATTNAMIKAIFPLSAHAENQFFKDSSMVRLWSFCTWIAKGSNTSFKQMTPNARVPMSDTFRLLCESPTLACILSCTLQPQYLCLTWGLKSLSTFSASASLAAWGSDVFWGLVLTLCSVRLVYRLSFAAHSPALQSLINCMISMHLNRYPRACLDSVQTPAKARRFTLGLPFSGRTSAEFGISAKSIGERCNATRLAVLPAQLAAPCVLPLLTYMSLVGTALYARESEARTHIKAYKIFWSLRDQLSCGLYLSA